MSKINTPETDVSAECQSLYGQESLANIRCSLKKVITSSILRMSYGSSSFGFEWDGALRA